MSWIPPSGSYDPESRRAPRPAAAAPAFTFGRSLCGEQGQAAADSISSRPEKANFDPPVETLRWWQQPRSAATVGGAANADVEAFWAAARQQPGAVAALCNTSARLANKAVGVGSTVKASLGDHEQFSIAGAASAYKTDLCGGHVKVGKRGVALPPEAMAAFQESREQARRNKEVSKSTNMTMKLF
ncbi:hypothetical protein ABPG75_013654 [Micractinium tetrahymenae]